MGWTLKKNTTKQNRRGRKMSRRPYIHPLSTDKDLQRRLYNKRDTLTFRLYAWCISASSMGRHETKGQWGLCAVRHGIQNSMEAILACHQAQATKILDWVAFPCERWCMRAGPIALRDHNFWTKRFCSMEFDGEHSVVKIGTGRPSNWRLNSARHRLWCNRCHLPLMQGLTTDSNCSWSARIK